MLQPNTNRRYLEPVSADELAFLGDPSVGRARALIDSILGHSRTPLRSLPGLAARLGVGTVSVKDEGERLGLASFKAMGGAYAVFRVVQEAAQRAFAGPVPGDRLLDQDVRAVAESLTVCCATDGNHGRSVAMGAKLIGCRAVIFLHHGVSTARERAIRQLGAETVRVDGSYDDSVEMAARQAAGCGWTMVTDTSWPGNEHVPALVMQGYGVIAAEVADEIETPTHVFLQAGVGGFAAAVAGYFALRTARRPAVIVVEPERAACLYRSNQKGERTATVPARPTVMAMLDCHQPSLLAWSVLERVADYFMTVEEGDALDAMRLLASPAQGDPPIVSGESGGAGLAGLLVAARGGWFERLGLDARSRVLLFNTEGATDPDLYHAIVGREPEQVRSAAAPMQPHGQS